MRALLLLVQGSDATHATRLLARSAGSQLPASALTTARATRGGVGLVPAVAAEFEQFRRRSSRLRLGDTGSECNPGKRLLHV